jgi:hypothetical protein
MFSVDLQFQKRGKMLLNFSYFLVFVVKEWTLE